MIDVAKAKADAEEGLRIAEKATKEPWVTYGQFVDGPEEVGSLVQIAEDGTKADLEFIADSRTRAPEAYRNVVALSEENETLRDALQKVGDERETFIRAHDAMTKHACELEAERDEARAWVRRLTESERVMTCAFCGHAYPPRTPASNHDALTAHVLVCAKHPMRAAELAEEKMTRKAEEHYDRAVKAETERDKLATQLADLKRYASVRERLPEDGE